MNIVYGCASNGKASPKDLTHSLGPALRTGALPAHPVAEQECLVSGSVPRLLLTIDEAAVALSLGRSHTYRYVQTGELRSIKIGRSRRIPVSALEEFVHRLQAEQAEEVAG